MQSHGNYQHLTHMCTRFPQKVLCCLIPYPRWLRSESTYKLRIICETLWGSSLVSVENVPLFLKSTQGSFKEWKTALERQGSSCNYTQCCMNYRLKDRARRREAELNTVPLQSVLAQRQCDPLGGYRCLVT